MTPNGYRAALLHAAAARDATRLERLSRVQAWCVLRMAMRSGVAWLAALVLPARRRATRR